MSKKVQEPNYQLVLSSAISSLQQTYREYKKAIIDNLSSTWIDDSGAFVVHAGADERNLKIKELEKEVIRLQFKVEELKGMVAE